MDDDPTQVKVRFVFDDGTRATYPHEEVMAWIAGEKSPPMLVVEKAFQTLVRNQIADWLTDAAPLSAPPTDPPLLN